MPRRRPWQHCLGATSSPVGPERRSPRRASDGRNGALMWPERSDVKESLRPWPPHGLHLRTGCDLIYLWSVACIFATVDLIADISAGDVIIPDGELFA